MSDSNSPDEAVETDEDDTIIAKALKWSVLGILILGSVGGGILYWVTRPDAAPPVVVTETGEVGLRALPELEVPALPFADITKSAGIDFVHENGAYGRKFLPETMTGGCAFFDFDSDGDPDILLTSFDRWPWEPKTERGGDADSTQKAATPALYENDGTGKFKNVTAGSGLDVPLFGNGVACGDYDNDGLVDVYFSTIGKNRLFHNEGNGRFKDVSATCGATGPDSQWSSSCGWLDYDSDGDLDLFVCNYVAWSKETDEELDFTLDGSLRGYGRPTDFAGVFPDLYRNDGDGQFTDVSAAAGIEVANLATGEPLSKSLGVCFSDVNADGRIDVVVANDTVPNMLLVNLGDGRFEELGTLAGIAFDTSGQVRGAMGIDIGYARNSEAATIAIGNYSNEMTAFYVAHEPVSDPPQFSDEAVSNGIGPMTRVELTFGVFFIDIDLDGRLDLFAANGHLEGDINKVLSSQHYEQSPQLLWNCGPEYDSEFMVATSDKTGEDFSRPMVGRGASYADIDGDGDLDILIASCGQPVRLMRNEQDSGNHWLRFKLNGSASNRDAIGAVVHVELDDGVVLRKSVMPTCSYQSQVELPITFGLGANEKIRSVIIRWPGGNEQTLKDVSVDQLLSVDEK